MTQGICLPEEVRQIMDRLQGAGYAVYVVGGFLRDLLLQKPTHDIDLASSATPDQVRALFPDYKLLPTGLAHGTLTILAGDRLIELTSFRREGPYSDHRHPDQVWFTQSIEEDLARRDFTINAMAYHPDQGLLDPWGGLKDLDARLIRAVGRPRDRLGEDALRIMRGLRFASQLAFDLEADTRQAMRDQSPLLDKLAPERLKPELEAFLGGQAVARFLVEEAQIWGQLIPELDPLGREGRDQAWSLDQLSRRLTAVRPDPLMRMAALLYDLHMPSRAMTVLRRLRFTNDQVKSMDLLLSAKSLELAADRRSLCRALRLLGQDLFFDHLALRLADSRACLPQNTRQTQELEAVGFMARQLIDQGHFLDLSDLAINGRDLLALGYRGPAIGVRLDQILEAVCRGQVSNQRQALLQFLESIDDERLK